MAKIPVALVVQLVEWGIQAFAKKRKVRKVLELVGESVERGVAFKSARAKIDAAEAAAEGVSLTVDETEALDFVMDQFSAAARKVKKHL
jgi:hypothetical protein